MTSKHKLWAVFWLAVCLATVAAHLRHHEGCIAWCTNIATAGGN